MRVKESVETPRDAASRASITGVVFDRNSFINFAASIFGASGSGRGTNFGLDSGECHQPPHCIRVGWEDSMRIQHHEFSLGK